MGSLQPFNLSDIIKVTMKQSVYDYSFEMRRARNHRLGITFGLIVSVVFFITMFLNFILFPVLVRSDSMDSDIPKNSAVFVTPLDRNPERGDVVYLSRLDDEKLGAGQVVINKLCEFFTLQQFCPFGYTNRMSGKPSIRRVIGLPGDTVRIKDYVAYVKTPEDNTFLSGVLLDIAQEGALARAGFTGEKEGMVSVADEVQCRLELRSAGVNGRGGGAHLRKGTQVVRGCRCRALMVVLRHPPEVLALRNYFLRGRSPPAQGSRW